MSDSVWPENLRLKLEKNLAAVIENMSDEDIQEAIREAIDLPEFIKGIFEEEASLKQALKEKLVASMGEVIDGLENYDFGGESLDEVIHGSVDFEKEIKSLMLYDEEVIRNLKDKLKALLSEQIEKIDENDLPGWEDLLSILDIDEVLKKIVVTEEMQVMLGEKVKEVLRDDIEKNFNDDDLPEWDNLMLLIDADNLIKKVVQGRDAKEALEKRIINILAEHVDQSMSIDDIPADFLQSLGAKDRIREILSDSETKKKLMERLEVALKQLMVDFISDRSIDLGSLLKEDAALKSSISRIINEFLKDPKVMEKIKRNIKFQLTGQEDLRSKLAKSVLGRMFSR